MGFRVTGRNVEKVTRQTAGHEGAPQDEGGPEASAPEVGVPEASAPEAAPPQAGAGPAQQLPAAAPHRGRHRLAVGLLTALAAAGLLGLRAHQVPHLSERLL